MELCVCWDRLGDHQKAYSYHKKAQELRPRQERHILHRKDAGYNTLVSMAARHLIANGDLPLLCDVAANDLVYAAARHLL